MVELIKDYEGGAEGGNIPGASLQGASTATFRAAAKQRGNFGGRYSAVASSYSFSREVQSVEATTAAEVLDFICPTLPTTTDKTILAFRAGPVASPAALAVTAAITPLGKIRVQAGGATVVNPFPTGTTGDVTLIPGQSYRLIVMVSGQSATAGRVDARLIRKSSGVAIGTVQSTAANVKTLPIIGCDVGVSPTTDQAWSIDVDDARFIPNHPVGTQASPAWPGDYVEPVADLAGTLTVTPSSGTVPFTVTAVVSNMTGGTGTALRYTYAWGDGATTGPTSNASATHEYTVAKTNPGYTVAVDVENT
jgi:hypothetical protein